MKHLTGQFDGAVGVHSAAQRYSFDGQGIVTGQTSITAALGTEVAADMGNNAELNNDGITLG